MTMVVQKRTLYIKHVAHRIEDDDQWSVNSYVNDVDNEFEHLLHGDGNNIHNFHISNIHREHVQHVT